MTQTLTIPETLAAVRKALAENRLSAQHGGGCVYRTPEGYGCAIGVCLSEETAAAVDAAGLNDQSVRLIAFDEHVVLDGPSPFYVELQASHDAWANGRKSQAAFVAALNRLEAEYLGAAS
jgi:hypothetical protein